MLCRVPVAAMTWKFVQSEKSVACCSEYCKPAEPVKNRVRVSPSRVIERVGVTVTLAGATRMPISPDSESLVASVTVWVKRARPVKPPEGVKRTVLPSGRSCTRPAEADAGASWTERTGELV